jgi:hypothetical protein
MVWQIAVRVDGSERAYVCLFLEDIKPNLETVAVAGSTSDLAKDDHLEVAVLEALETQNFVIDVGTSEPVH